MALAVRDLWTSLIRLGLVEPAAAADLRKRAAKDIAGDTADDPVALAKYLIAQGVLTKFQAKRILAQRSGELRQGQYLVLDRIEQPPLSRWLRAQHLPSGTAVLIYPCQATADAKNHVDPAWLRPHTAVAADGLQPLDVVQLAGTSGSEDKSWRGLVVSALPAGQTLSQWLGDKGPLDRLSAIALGQLIGGALQAMHAASLIHGGLRPGRVWIGNDGAVYLLRSGGGPPIFPGDPAQPVYDWFDDDAQAADFASPQWLRGVTHADAQSDVYSLGAVIYTALTQKPVAAGSLPPEVSQALAAGAHGDPLLRVLAAALAPDLAQRFADVASCLRALEAVRELLSGDRVNAAAIAPAPAGQAAVPAEQAATMRAATTPERQARDALPVEAAPAATTAIPRPRVPDAGGPVSVPAARPQNNAAAGVLPAAHAEPAAVAAAEQNVPAAAPAQGTPAAALTGSLPAINATAPLAAAAPARPVRKRTRRTRRGPVIVGSSAVAVLLLLVAIVLRSNQQNPAASRPAIRLPAPQPIAPVDHSPAAAAGPGTSSASAAAAPAAQAATSGGFELVSSDELLWVPPWPADVAPPPLELIVPGAQVILSLRPRQLLRSDAPADWNAWFGPELEPTLQTLRQRCGVAPQQIERLMISLVGGTDGQPAAALGVRLAEPTELGTLRQQWNATASKTLQGHTVFTGDDPAADGYFVPGESVDDATAVSSFALASLEHIELIAETGGGAIPLPRAMQTAWDQSSGQADVVALVSPNFLFADGRKLLQRFAPRAIEPLRDLLIPEVSAALLSIDTSAAWYAEVRLVPGGGATSAGLLRLMQERMAELPTLAESFVVHSDVPATWRALAIRLPQYLRAITEQTRFGLSASLPTANFYLPAEAAPQVTLAALLALSTPISSATAVTSTSPPQPQSLSMQQLLETKLSISFEQESLEFAVSMIGEEFASVLPAGSPRPKITIIGSDLEKSGITQNQQIRNFQMRDAPLREVLTRLVVGANPDKTATSAADAKQSLVWVVDPAATSQTPSLLITTRPQAEAKGYQLPPEFVAR